jgi:CBS domain-containing protein
MGLAMEEFMKVREVMTDNVELISPDDTIRDAAQTMSALDVGALPVGENDRLIGMITDRDIVVRAVAKGLGPETAVRGVMSNSVKYCFEDDEIDDIVQNMADIQVRRLLVVDERKRLVGIVSLADVATNSSEAAGQALSGISLPNL